MKKENSVDFPPGGGLDSELTPETKRNYRLSNITFNYNLIVFGYYYSN